MVGDDLENTRGRITSNKKFGDEDLESKQKSAMLIKKLAQFEKQATAPPKKLNKIKTNSMESGVLSPLYDPPREAETE